MIVFASKQACERAKTVLSSPRVLFARVVSGIQRFISPVSENEDSRRKEYILNVILCLSIAFLVLLLGIIIFNKARLGSAYGGIEPEYFSVIVLFYISLFVISRKGKYRISAYLLLGFYVIGTIYSGWIWGESLPATLLTNAIIIVTASILIDSRFGAITAFIMIVITTLLGIHEAEVLNVPYWHMQEISPMDIAGYCLMLLFIGFISWISNREIAKSLKRARASEQLLEIERNGLEQKVAERTEALISTERARTEELERIAKFGDLSQGLFHDLVQPLSAVSMSIESLETGGVTRAETKEAIINAVKSSKRMRAYMESVKRCLGNRESMPQIEYSDMKEEVDTVRDILAYKARMSDVEIRTHVQDSLAVRSHPMRIHQMLLNLASNAVESFIDVTDDRKKAVEISCRREERSMIIEVSDNGCGMTEDQTKNIFSKPASTKKGGRGIGMTTVRSIAEHELHGKIDIKSEIGKGTRFIISIPIQENEPRQKIHTKDGRGDGTATTG